MKALRSVSTIYRDLRDLFEELAARAEDAEGTLITLAKKNTGAKPERRTHPIDRPEGESDELARARARRILRRNGYAETER